jgi:hypothetical protein
LERLKTIWARFKVTKFSRVFMALWGIKFEIMPKWMVPVVVVALAIPGPQDEIFVFLLLGLWVAFHKELRRKVHKVIREA